MIEPDSLSLNNYYTFVDCPMPIHVSIVHQLYWGDNNVQCVFFLLIPGRFIMYG